MTDHNDFSPAYIAAPSGGRSGPGVVVIHAFWGLNDVFKGFCDRLAEAGFVAAAPDLYDGVVVTEIEDAFRMADALKSDQAMEKVLGAARALQAHPRVCGKGLGAVGFSLGGSYAVALSTVEPQAVKAVVTYYGAGEGTFDEATAAYLGHFAENDPYEETEYIVGLEEAIRAGGKEVTFYTYPDTSHWFIEENRPEYNPAAAQTAWERTLAFLRERLSEKH